jgi:hypothetical protein
MYTTCRQFRRPESGPGFSRSLFGRSFDVHLITKQSGASLTGVLLWCAFSMQSRFVKGCLVLSLANLSLEEGVYMEIYKLSF